MGIASGAVVVVPAATASAAPSASHQYNSTASAVAGKIAIAGQAPTGGTGQVTANDTNGQQGSNLGLPTGLTLPAGLGHVSGVDVITTNAEAIPAGMSAACSALASGGCKHAGQQAAPISVELSLQQLVQQAGVSLPIGLPSIGADKVVLGITGLTANCTAGPAGTGSNFTASSGAITVTMDIRNGNASLIGGPRTIHASGNALSGLSGPLGPVLQMLQGQVGVAIDPGSSSAASPKSAATAGRVTVSAGGNQVLEADGGSVSCGPNQAAPSTNTSGTKPVSPGTGSTGGSGGSGTLPSSGVKPLTSIQTDEGRWAPASNETPLWAGLAASGLALAGGFTLWRRRVSRS